MIDVSFTSVRRAAVLTAVLGLAVSLPAAGHAQTVQGTFDRTLSVSGAVDLDVTTGAGDVVVRAGAAGSVRVIGHIRATNRWLGGDRDAAERVKALEAKPPVAQTGNTIRVGYIENRDLSQNVSISYEITAPTSCTLRSRTGSGDQRVGDVSGPVDIASGSGDLTVANIDGRVEASAGSGSITADRVRGGFSARTGSGKVGASEVAGEITVSTGSGDVTVSRSGPGAVRVSVASGDAQIRGVQGALQVDSASGDITVQGTPAAGWQVSSASGEVILEVPTSAAFDLEARSSSGAIDSRHPVTMTGTIDRRSVNGQVRGGGPLVRVRTSSGGIQIR